MSETLEELTEPLLTRVREGLTNPIMCIRIEVGIPIADRIMEAGSKEIMAMDNGRTGPALLIDRVQGIEQELRIVLEQVIGQGLILAQEQVQEPKTGLITRAQ